MKIKILKDPKLNSSIFSNVSSGCTFVPSSWHWVRVLHVWLDVRTNTNNVSVYILNDASKIFHKIMLISCWIEVKQWRCKSPCKRDNLTYLALWRQLHSLKLTSFHNAEWIAYDIFVIVLDLIEHLTGSSSGFRHIFKENIS